MSAIPIFCFFLHIHPHILIRSHEWYKIILSFYFYSVISVERCNRSNKSAIVNVRFVCSRLSTPDLSHCLCMENKPGIFMVIRRVFSFLLKMSRGSGVWELCKCSDGDGWLSRRPPTAKVSAISIYNNISIIWCNIMTFL